MKINENTLARNVCVAEGGKVSVPIAQVKEIIKLTLNEFAVADPFDVMDVIRKHRKKYLRSRVNTD